MASKYTLTSLSKNVFMKVCASYFSEAQKQTISPTQVWAEKIQTNQIVEFGHIDYCSGRGMAWGKYLFQNHCIRTQL